MSQIAEKLAIVQQRIAEICHQCGRDPKSVRLLAVSKTKSIEAVREAIAAGQHHFGENYLQDALTKVPLAADVNWHFIGHIQSNKTRDIARYFNWVHTAASAKVLTRLNSARTEEQPNLQVMLQVNTSGEDGRAARAARCAIRPGGP